MAEAGFDPIFLDPRMLGRGRHHSLLVTGTPSVLTSMKEFVIPREIDWSLFEEKVDTSIPHVQG